MGCKASRMEGSEESVARCRERWRWIKLAVSSRYAFAASHSFYAASLKDVASALSKFARAELLASSSSSSSSSSAAAAVSSSAGSPVDSLPPRPRRPAAGPSPKIQRSSSMPHLPPDNDNKNPIIVEAEGEEVEDEDVDQLLHRSRSRRRKQDELRPTAESAPPMPRLESNGTDGWDFFDLAKPPGGPAQEARPESQKNEVDIKEVKKSPTPQPPTSPPGSGVAKEELRTLEKAALDPPARHQPESSGSKCSAVHRQHPASAPPKGTGNVDTVASDLPRVDLLQLIMDINEHFLKASESAREVSKMLEDHRTHYDNRGHIDHSEKVKKIITWSRPSRGIADVDDEKDDIDTDGQGTLAVVLDKILAWEKKLYDEVKAGDFMKIEYQSKVALLNKQKNSGGCSEDRERTKAAVSHLQTRYVAYKQSINSTMSEIKHLRDNQLYPRLMDLVDGMAKMWNKMHMHHEAQQKIATNLKGLPPIEAGGHNHNHHKNTTQLRDFVKEWHSELNKLVIHQKKNIRALRSWLNLKVIPYKTSSKENASSPPRTQQSPIQALLYAWNDHLEELPEKPATDAILKFLEGIDKIIKLQNSERKKKERCKELRKAYACESQAFKDLCSKRSQQKIAPVVCIEEMDQENHIAERKSEVDSLKSLLDDEVQDHKTKCKQAREESLAFLKICLPELFLAMSKFALDCADMYLKLKLVSAVHSPVAN